MLDKADDKLKAKPATVKRSIPANKEAAVHTVEAFQNGSYGLQSSHAVLDSVAQHRLTTHSSLLDEPWLGAPKEELDS